MRGEVAGMEGNVVTLQEIFIFEKKGINEEGQMLGGFRATGIRPGFSERLRLAGSEVPEEWFDPQRIYE